MATRSTIAIEHDNGSIQQIYCHWDGYPEHNGKILTQSYIDSKKLQELIDMGDMSSLDSTLDTCKFYSRDMGEDFETVKARLYYNRADLFENSQSQEFNYLLSADGDWLVSFDDERDFQPLFYAVER
jgi:hypothetical protein